jgi:hypothetical protein
MSYVVHVTMTEEEEVPTSKKVHEAIHVEGTYKYRNLELAREAAEVACHAAEKLHPSQTTTVDDDDWTGHPDRSD